MLTRCGWFVVLQIRLVEEDTSYCTYGEAYEVNCARYGRQPDQPIVQFKQRICDDRGQLIIDPKGELRQQVWLSTHCFIFVLNSSLAEALAQSVLTCQLLVHVTLL